MTKRQAGRLGGLTTARTHGKAHMQAIGKRGAAVTWQRYTLQPTGLSAWAMVERTTGKVKALITYAGFLPSAHAQDG